MGERGQGIMRQGERERERERTNMKVENRDLKYQHWQSKAPVLCLSSQDAQGLWVSEHSRTDDITMGEWGMTNESGGT